MRLELPDLSIIVGEEPFLDDVIGDFWWKVGDLWYYSGVPQGQLRFRAGNS